MPEPKIGGAAPANGAPTASAPSAPPSSASTAPPAAHAAGAPSASPAMREPSARALRYREHRIPRRHRVFVNRNLRMTRIRAIGFDLDHTLAHYDPIPVEELAFDLTKKKLVESRGYPREILAMTYDPNFVIRGIVVDKKRGNLLKMDYFNFVSRATHGLTSLRSEERKRAYRSSRIRVGHENYVSVDTLFHLPEVYLFACVIDFLEKRRGNGGNGARPGNGGNGARAGAGLPPIDYEKVYTDVREMIDEAHRDGTLKSVITSDLERYIRFDPELRVVLEEFRRAGKKLFLLTNSEWAYTDTLLRHLLQRGRGAPSRWTELFNVILVESAKPGFFSEEGAPEPIPELKGQKLLAVTGRGGSGAYLERALGAAGEHVLYFGDHTYGDILQSKRVLGWRTAMLVPELDREIQVTQDYAKDFDRLSKLSSERHHIEIDKAAIGRELRRLTLVLSEGEATDPQKREEIAKRIQEIPEQIAEMEKRSIEVAGEVESLQVKIDRAYNPRWGSLFREGNESSRFGHQLKDFACLYTSRVSNFLHYPWNYYYQSPVGYMPHDI